jgi:hypothetical protein
MNEALLALNGRRFLECFSSSAGALALMPGALTAVAQDAPRITLEMLQAAERIAGVTFSSDERQAVLTRLNGAGRPFPGFDALRSRPRRHAAGHRVQSRRAGKGAPDREEAFCAGSRSWFRCRPPTRSSPSCP